MFYRKHARVQFVPEGPSRTRQEFAADADINTIMARYKKTGMLPQDQRQPVYVDNWDAPDLMTAMNVLNMAQDAFLRLPAKVRKEFDHDPVEFVKFAENPENIGKLREWGLADPEKAPDAPMRVEVVNQPAAPAEGTQ